jgi:hypothetical protein
MKRLSNSGRRAASLFYVKEGWKLLAQARRPINLQLWPIGGTINKTSSTISCPVIADATQWRRVEGVDFCF